MRKVATRIERRLRRRVADPVNDVLARIAKPLHRHWEAVVTATLVVMGTSFFWQQQLEAVGFAWWTQIGKNIFFVWILALAVGGPSLFKGSEGGATAPARS